MPEEKDPRQQEFRIGVLVIGGFLAVVILILVSDKLSFETEYIVTAYMDNAAGLRNGSPVELSGIKIGEIHNIQTASKDSAPGAIMAVLKINERYTLYKSSALTVGSSGIFGDSYLSFANPAESAGQALPKNGSAVVIAEPGFIDELSRKGEGIVNSISEILNPDTRKDIKRLIKESADAATETNKLVKTINASSDHITSTLANIDAASLEVKNRSQEIGKQSSTILSEVDGGIKELRQHVQRIGKSLDGIAVNLERSLKSVDQLSASTNEIITGSKTELLEAMKNLQSMSADMKVVAEDIRNGKGVLGKLMRSDALAKDLDKVAVSIQDLSQRLADHPEILIFGDSEEDRTKARLERQRRQQRRAFNEGYGSRLGTRRPGGEGESAEDTAPEEKTEKKALAEDGKQPVEVIE